MCVMRNISHPRLDSKRNLIAAVLKSLVEGEKTFYTLTRKEKLSSNLPILGILDELIHKGLIEKGEMGPRRRVPYRLTLPGLCAAFTLNSELWSNVDTIMQRWGYLDPLILGNWQLISSLDREEVIDSLKKIMEEISTAHLEYNGEKPISKEELEKTLVHFRKAFLLPRFLFIEKINVRIVFHGSDEWRKQVIKNEQIRSFLKENVKAALDDFRSTIESVIKILEQSEAILKELNLI